jgi:hypothetical protein
VARAGDEARHAGEARHTDEAEVTCGDSGFRGSAVRRFKSAIDEVISTFKLGDEIALAKAATRPCPLPLPALGLVKISTSRIGGPFFTRNIAEIEGG